MSHNTHEDYFPHPLQQFQFLSKYARWREQDKRRETWSECCQRVLEFFQSRPQLKNVPSTTWDELAYGLKNLDALPALRVVQMAGPALERCACGSRNCWALAITDLDCFGEILYLLMQGGGVGFSVEEQFIRQLPMVAYQKGLPPALFIVEDSTEGWCDAVTAGIWAWFSGHDLEFDLSHVRPQGARLRIKGGRASGPGPLRDLLYFIRDRILARQGCHLTALDCHDIVCRIGKIVHVGGVRRSSLISVSDLTDLAMRSAKSGTWWEWAPWRDMANNSAVYTTKPTWEEFSAEWTALRESGSGERGICNRLAMEAHLPARRRLDTFLPNPCHEIALRASGQGCNLSIVVARPEDSVETLHEKVRLATIFGTLQATLTNFQYIRPSFRRNEEEERLLGVDITGQLDCPLLRPGAPGRAQLLASLKECALKTNEEWAHRLGIPVGAAITCIKPSGNSSVLLNCSPGIHPRWSPYQIRRVRVDHQDPLGALLRDQGVPWQQDPLNPSLDVFDFLLAAPAGSPTREDMTALDQLNNWLEWQLHWAEHMVSCTVYVRPSEWDVVQKWVWEHWEDVCGLSFLPYDGGTYRAAPNEALSEEEYYERLHQFPQLDWSQLPHYEKEDQTSGPTVECNGPVCESI